MALTATTLDHGVHTGGGTPVATASVSPTAGRLLLVFVGSVSGSSVTPGTPTISGLSGTWTSPTGGGIGYDSAGTGQGRIDVFRCSDYAGSGALSIAYASGTPDTVIWSVIEAAGADATAGGSSNGIIQTVTASGTAANPTVTLAALASASNGAFGLLGSESSNSVNPITSGAGFTDLANDFDVASTQPSAADTEWKINATTVNWTRSGTNSWGTLAIEVAALAATFVPRQDQITLTAVRTAATW